MGKRAKTFDRRAAIRLQSIILLSALTCFILPPRIASAIDENTPVPREYQNLRRAMGREEYTQAHEQINRLLRQNEVYPRVFEALAMLYVYEERIAEGIAFFENMLASGKHHGEVAGALAILEQTRKRSAESFKYARMALENGCRAIWPYEIFVQKSIELDSSAWAWDFLQVHIRRAPENWPYRYALALWHAAKNDPSAACRELRALLAEGKKHWRIYYVLGQNLSYAGDVSGALQTFEGGIIFCRDFRDEEGVARLLEGRAGSEMRLGEPEKARASLEASRELAVRLGNQHLEYRVLLSASQISINQNQWSAARGYLLEVEQRAQKFADHYSLLNAHYYRGQLERRMGRWSAAMASYLQAHAVAQSLGLEEYASQLLYAISLIDIEAGRKEQALARLQQNENILLAEGSQLHRTTYWRNLAMLFLELGHIDSALAYVNKALPLARQSQDQKMILGLSLIQGSAWSQLENEHKARAIIDSVAQSARRAGFVSEWVEAQVALAKVELRGHHYAAAKTVLTEAIAALPEMPQYLAYLEIMSLLAQANLHEDRVAQALAIYRSAADAISQHTQALRPDHLSSLAREERDIFFGLSRACLRSGEIEAAILVTEHARDLVVRRKQWQALLLNETEIDDARQKQLAGMDSLLLRLRFQQAAAVSQQEQLQFEGQLRKASIERDILLEGLIEKPRMPSLAREDLDLPAFRRMLHARGEVACSFFVSDTLSLVFFIAGDTVIGREIPTGHTELARLLLNIHPLLHPASSQEPVSYAARFDTASAHEAYRILLAEFLRDRPETQLAIVPDDVLHALPFDMLVTEPQANRRTRFLLERFAIRNGISLAALQQDGNEELRIQSFLMVANPRFAQAENGGPPALRNGLTYPPVGRRELEAVQLITDVHTVLTGEEASRRRLLPTLQKCDWLHLASHSLSRPGEPLFGEIALAKPEGRNEPEKLYAFEIFRLRLGAQLAILSGCETARGAFLNGEGFEGFVQAFRAAGTPSVIASLWKVEDEPAAQFFKLFYENLREKKSAALALQAAKLEMLQNPNYNILDWAAFNYYGRDWQVHLPARGRRLRDVVILSAALALIAVSFWTVLSVYVRRTKRVAQ